jgi:vacuolar-type H+-ATPase subunit E/Vma4
MRLIEKMEADVSAKVEAILAEAKGKAADIEAEAANKIEQLRKAARLETKKRLELEKARGASKILQAVRSEEADLKNDLMEQVYSTARKELDELDDDRYDTLFEQIAGEALKDLKHPVTVSVREGDKGRAEKAIKASGADATVVEDLDEGGGIRLRSESEEVLVDNTLAVRLERSRIHGVTIAGQILFGEGAPDDGSKKKKTAAKKSRKKK